jgi:hypothetical protein
MTACGRGPGPLPVRPLLKALRDRRAFAGRVSPPRHSRRTCATCRGWPPLSSTTWPVRPILPAISVPSRRSGRRINRGTCSPPRPCHVPSAAGGTTAQRALPNTRSHDEAISAGCGRRIRTARLSLHLRCQDRGPAVWRIPTPRILRSGRRTCGRQPNDQVISLVIIDRQFLAPLRNNPRCGKRTLAANGSVRRQRTSPSRAGHHPVLPRRRR